MSVEIPVWSYFAWAWKSMHAENWIFLLWIFLSSYLRSQDFFFVLFTWRDGLEFTVITAEQKDYTIRWKVVAIATFCQNVKKCTQFFRNYKKESDNNKKNTSRMIFRMYFIGEYSIRVVESFTMY